MQRLAAIAAKPALVADLRPDTRTVQRGWGGGSRRDQAGLVVIKKVIGSHRPSHYRSRLCGSNRSDGPSSRAWCLSGLFCQA